MRAFRNLMSLISYGTKKNFNLIFYEKRKSNSLNRITCITWQTKTKQTKIRHTAYNMQNEDSMQNTIMVHHCHRLSSFARNRLKLCTCNEYMVTIENNNKKWLWSTKMHMKISYDAIKPIAADAFYCFEAVNYSKYTCDFKPFINNHWNVVKNCRLCLLNLAQHFNC